jgi:ferritin
MIGPKVQTAFNEQIHNEFASAYLYLAMSAQMESQNYPGAAHWLKVQYKEEVTHAERLFKFVNDRAGRVTLEAIEKPPADSGPFPDVFKAVFAHEQKVTAAIHRLYETAVAEKDYAAQVELQWFIKEQVEEEKTVQEIVAQLEACEGRPHLLLMIDHRLSKRAG